MDEWPAWSHNGRWIAYHRRFPSTDGPPGLYIIPAAGGRARFLAPGDFWTPTYLRFSPDDRYLSCDFARQLLIVDLASGELLRPMYSDQGATSADWSPDGSRLVFRRTIYVFGTPPESTGIHILDLRTGTEHPVLVEGRPFFGDCPVWSSDTSQIAVIRVFQGTNQSELVLLAADGSQVRTLVESPMWMSGMRRFVRREDGLDGLDFSGTTSLGYGRTYINWDGTGMHHLNLPGALWYRDTYSPDGALGVGGRLAPTDTLELLFIFDPDDVSGATMRQLTWYNPPQSGRGASTR